MKTLLLSLSLLTILAVPIAEAKGVRYGGGHHTSSHGGSYSGGQGSSHKGGTYKNPKTDNSYGSHK